MSLNFCQCLKADTLVNIQSWGLKKTCTSIFYWNEQIKLRKQSHPEMLWGEGWTSDGEVCWMGRCWISALHSLKAARRAKAPLKHVTVRNVNFNTFVESLCDGTCMLVWNDVALILSTEGTSSLKSFAVKQGTKIDFKIRATKKKN